MAGKNLEGIQPYTDFSSDVAYELSSFRARVDAMRALLHEQDDYDTRDGLVNLGFLVSALFNDLEELSVKVSESSPLYEVRQSQSRLVNLVAAR